MRIGQNVRMTRALCLALLALAAFAPGALGATFRVNNTADSTDAGGCVTVTACSLRDAVTAANAATGSTIELPANPTTHYTLNAVLPVLTNPTTIAGEGASSTIIDGNGKGRVLDFEPGTPASDTLTIHDLTVTGGITKATDGTTDAGDGGGLFSLGGLNLTDVQISGNTAALGGGGVMDGTVHNEPAPAAGTFVSVTISGNQVTGGAGNGQGGGAVIATGFSMTNSTIANNTVGNIGTNEGGGLLATDGTATLLGDTITGNSAAKPGSAPVGDFGGGISGDTVAANGPFDSTIDATNTIVAGNTVDGAEHDCDLIDTGAGTSNHNLTEGTTCGFTDSGTVTTTSPGLGALQNNGGPLTTVLPTRTSPAIDAGNSTGCPATDERGVTRPQLAGCDIGATELAPPSATTGPASQITASTATVGGAASNPAVAAGTATIQYGTTTGYGSTAPIGSVGAGAASATQSAALSGLAGGTTYHYRLVVSTTDGTATGADQTFSTESRPTSTAIGCQAHTVLPGATTTCVVTVTQTGSDRGGAPSGTVGLALAGVHGAAIPSSCTLTPAASGTSSCTVRLTAGTAIGTDTLVATYHGDAGDGASIGNTVVSVSSAASRTSVRCAPSSLAPTFKTRCTATVTGANAHPTGTVTLSSSARRDSLQSHGACNLREASSNAKQSACSLLLTAGSTTGRHTVSARYAGDAQNAASASHTSILVEKIPVRLRVRSIKAASPPPGCESVIRDVPHAAVPSGEAVGGACSRVRVTVTVDSSIAVSGKVHVLAHAFYGRPEIVLSRYTRIRGALLQFSFVLPTGRPGRVWRFTAVYGGNSAYRIAEVSQRRFVEGRPH